MTRTVLRRFGPRSITVTTVHPQHGELDRGRIYPQPGCGTQGVWQIATADHEPLDNVTGDYLDAEAALLDATAGLDELDEGN